MGAFRRAEFALGIVSPLQLLALAGHLPLAVLVAGAIAVVVVMVLINTCWATMQQQHVPNEYLSRVDSLGWMISLVAAPIGMATVGPIASWIGVETTLVVSATLIALALAGVLAVRDFRELRPIVGTADG